MGNRAITMAVSCVGCYLRRRREGGQLRGPSYRPSLKLVGAVLRLAEVPLPGVAQVSVDGDVDLGVRSCPGNISCEDLHRVQHNWAGTWTEKQTEGRTKGKKRWRHFRFEGTGGSGIRPRAQEGVSVFLLSAQFRVDSPEGSCPSDLTKVVSQTPKMALPGLAQWIVC